MSQQFLTSTTQEATIKTSTNVLTHLGGKSILAAEDMGLVKLSRGDGAMYQLQQVMKPPSTGPTLYLQADRETEITVAENWISKIGTGKWNNCHLQQHKKLPS